MTPEPDEPALAVEEPAGVEARTQEAAEPASVDGAPPAGEPPSGEAEADQAGAPGGPPRKDRWFREGAVVVVVALIVAVLLHTYVVQTFYIPSGSMEPTLQVGDRILVNKLAYDLHGVHRGDIVVFSRPAQENCGGPEVNDLVKRVIGLPGDVMSVSGGHVYVNGRRLDESWLPNSEQGVTDAGPPGNTSNLSRPFKVPAGSYYVMGDNRTDSCDSRYWGPITNALIVGKVDLRFWPVTSLGLF